MGAQSNRTQSDSAIIERYMNQPSALPLRTRDAIEKLWEGRPVQLYALADLDETLKLKATWLVLGPRDLAVVTGDGDGGGPLRIQSIERARIKAVTERPGLSCATLTIWGEPEAPPLAVVRYTRRQRRAMENVKFILEQQARGETVAPAGDPDEVYAGAMAHPVRQAQAAYASAQFTVVWRLLSYLKPYRVKWTLGLLAAGAMTALSLAPPYLTKWLIDDVVKPFEGGTLSVRGALHAAWIIVAALAAIYALRGLCHYIRLRHLAVLAEYVARDIRHELYGHLQKLSLSFYSERQTGSIITRVSSDTDRLWDFIAFGVVEVTLSIVMLLGLSVVLLALDWRLGLVMVLPVPLLLLSFYLHSQQMSRYFTRIWRKWSSMTEVLSDTIPGMRVVKAFNQEPREVRRFNSRSEAVLDEANALHGVWTKFWPSLSLSLNAMTLVVWLMALPRLLAEPGTAAPLTLGTLMAFMLYMGMFMYPIETIGMMARMMSRATSSAMRVFEVLDTEPQIRDADMPLRLEPVQGRVTFDHVSFAYDGIRLTLRDVSFDVAPGEMIGLVGPSGAGKTTITNLIARFYVPTSGHILIDGENLNALDTGHFRRQIGMVLQDPHLFHGTVLDNIRYGLPEATLEQVIEAARAANAHDFICRLPQGYETVVGERGHTLSGGERQRVSIARAILNNPRILILDEATSSVDTETERKIQEALERLIHGRTVFAIAHRLSTLRRASRLLVFENGRLTEEGKHAELLEKEKGTYKKLYDLQHELHEMYAL
mgnify:CR=1 FL=1